MFAEIKHGTDIDYLSNFIMNCVPQNFGGIIHRVSQAKKYKHAHQSITNPTLDQYTKGYDIASWTKQNMLVLADPESISRTDYLFFPGESNFGKRQQIFTDKGLEYEYLGI